MRHLLRSAALVAALLASGAVHAGEQTVTLAVENMTCAACPFIVRKAMSSVPGVTKVDVSFAKKTAIVTFNDASTTLDAVTQASANAGYPAKAAGQSR
jgi:mercuric ion binding protein